MEKMPTAVSNTPLPLRAAQYVRMSTEHQQYSPENQLEIIRRARAIYEYGSVEKMIDDVNDRWFSEPGSGTPPPPLGPNYKQKKRQKNTVKADVP